MDGIVDAWHVRMRSLPGRIAVTAVNDLVTTIFPGKCRCCAAPLVRASVIPVCEACRTHIKPQTSSLCFRCGEALEMESARFAGQFPPEGLLCHICRLVPPPFERAVAYAVYENELREMIHLLKYERMRGIASLLGGKLAKAVLMLESAAERELVVVAVPLFPAKQRARGYNQSELLADAALDELRRTRPPWKLRCDYHLLQRVKDTESQFALSPKGRRRNLEGAFAVDTARVALGGEVLLIDDIYTTGATARQCAMVLRRAGVRKVWVATLARAQASRVAMWDAESTGTVKGFG